MTRTLRIALLIALVALATACGGDERESGPIKTGDPTRDTGTSSNVSTGDMGTGGGGDTSSNGGDAAPNNAGTDTGTANNGGDDTGGTGVDPPTGEVCPYTDLRQYAGNCDAVRGTGCTAPEMCIAGIQVDGPNTNLSAFCRESDIHVLEEGSTCSETEQCVPGTTCISFYSECRRLCYPDTSLGCEPGEFCRRPSRTWEGIGFCDTTCNL